MFEIDHIFLCLPQHALCCELKDYKLNDNFQKHNVENVLADKLHALLVMYPETYDGLYVNFHSILENGSNEVEFWLAKNFDNKTTYVLAYNALLEENILV